MEVEGKVRVISIKHRLNSTLIYAVQIVYIFSIALTHGDHDDEPLISIRATVTPLWHIVWLTDLLATCCHSHIDTKSQHLDTLASNVKIVKKLSPRPRLRLPSNAQLTQFVCLLLAI